MYLVDEVFCDTSIVEHGHRGTTPRNITRKLRFRVESRMTMRGFQVSKDRQVHLIRAWALQRRCICRFVPFSFVV